MRQLLLTVIAGGVMAMTGLAGAQTLLPDISPRGETTPASSPSGGGPSSPAGIPSRQGSSPPAAVPVGSLQAQLEAQQRDIETLIKTVGVLTEQLQQARPAPTGEDGGTQKVGAKQPDRGPVPGPLVLVQAAEDLRKTQEMLADLERERAAVAQAPADEQMKKQLELQRKQIDLLNRMVRLLADELAKQGPIVSKMQTQVATLEAHSKQGAQRDQELANALDNLTEHMDATQRSASWLPAPLKELFDPMYNNETPLSIYGALVERYTQFQPERWGTFETPTFSTFFLLTLNQRIFLEANVDLLAGAVDVPWAQIDFLLSDCVTAVVGRYLLPIGFYNERLAYEWGDKMPDDPLMFHQVSPLASTNGVQLRGSSYLFRCPVKMEYSVYAGNGMELPTTPATVADLADLSVLASSDNTHAKAVGGRLGVWVPQWGINGGVSGYFDYNYALAPPTLNLGIVSVDASYHRGNWDARFEGAYMKQQAAAVIGRDIQRAGLYCQLAYRPYDISNRILQKFEFVGRFGLERFVGIDPTQLDFTTFSDPTFVPVDRNQYAFSLNYYFYPSAIVKFGYEINQEFHRVALDDNVFFSQVVWAF
jgi:hypothetical protein